MCLRRKNEWKCGPAAGHLLLAVEPSLSSCSTGGKKLIKALASQRILSFPSCEVDIFLSHQHRLVASLACFLVLPVGILVLSRCSAVLSLSPSNPRTRKP